MKSRRSDGTLSSHYIDKRMQKSIKLRKQANFSGRLRLRGLPWSFEQQATMTSISNVAEFGAKGYYKGSLLRGVGFRGV